MVRGDWEGGTVKTRVENEAFGLLFDNIDTKNKRAQLVGKQGAEELTVLITPVSLSFLQITSVGDPILTTVFPVYKKGGNEFIAVTSRHLLLPSGKGEEPIPSQHHGSCLSGNTDAS